MENECGQDLCGQDLCSRSYHVCKAIWQAVVGETLACEILFVVVNNSC